MNVLLLSIALTPNSLQVSMSVPTEIRDDFTVSVTLQSKEDAPVRVYQPLRGLSVFPFVLYGQSRDKGYAVEYNFSPLFTWKLEPRQRQTATVRFKLDDLPTPVESGMTLFRFVYSDCQAAQIFRSDGDPIELPDGAWASGIYSVKLISGKIVCRKVDYLNLPLRVHFLKSGARLSANLRSGVYGTRSELVLQYSGKNIRIRELSDLQGHAVIDTKEKALEFINLATDALTCDLFPNQSFTRFRSIYGSGNESLKETGEGFEIERLATDLVTGNVIEVKESVTLDGRYRVVSKSEIVRTDLLHRQGKLIFVR